MRFRPSSFPILAALFVGALLSTSLFAAEQGFDRPGNDYRDFDLLNPDPELCKAACASDADCAAWTYVHPGVQGESARCWLKNPAPEAVADACCISGLGQTATAWPLEAGIDRPGSDYRDFDLAESDPQLCESACRDEAQCRAFTYVHPGIQGDAPRCWLKDAVPEATPSDCCSSAVKPE
jgi:hypothetical protein